MTHDKIMIEIKKTGGGRVYDYISVAIANDVCMEDILNNLDKLYLDARGKSNRDKLIYYINRYLASDGSYSTDEMLPSKAKRGNQGKPVKYDGVIYKTIKDAAKANGVHPETMRRKLQKGEAEEL